MDEAVKPVTEFYEEVVSAAEYRDYEEKEAVEFIHQLSNRLIREEYNIISVWN